MRKRTVIESGRDRRTLMADAGYGDVSVPSVLAGVLVAYGAFVVIASVVAGVIAAADSDVDLSRDWDRLGTAGGLAVAGVLFVSYLFGGYVAGRMARRAGTLHGLLVFLVGLVLAAGVALLVRQVADPDTVAANLRDLGLPTTADEWGDVGTVAGLASLAAMVLGSFLGGAMGERWHAKLLARALDPEVGAEADYRRQAAEAVALADERHTGSQERVRSASPAFDRGRTPGVTPGDTPPGGQGDHDGNGHATHEVRPEADDDVRPTKNGDNRTG